MKTIRSVIAIALVAIAAGCSSSSHVVVGQTRAPIKPENVKVFTEPPTKYERVAIVSASSKNSMAFSDQAMTDKAIARMKQEAAGLGANGVLIREVGTEQGSNVGTGASTGSSSGSSAVGVGTGVNLNLNNRNATGEAIYVIEE